MKINLKVRIKNPLFWVGIAGVVLTTTGTAPESLTTWGAVGEWVKALIANPYALVGVVIALFGQVYDPTTAGVSDSAQALTYDKPKNVMDVLAGVYVDDRRDEEDK